MEGTLAGACEHVNYSVVAVRPVPFGGSGVGLGPCLGHSFMRCGSFEYLVVQAERALFFQHAVIADANAQQLSALTPVQPPQLFALTPHSALVRSSYNKQQVATASCCLLSLWGELPLTRPAV